MSSLEKISVLENQDREHQIRQNDLEIQNTRLERSVAANKKTKTVFEEEYRKVSTEKRTAQEERDAAREKLAEAERQVALLRESNNEHKQKAQHYKTQVEFWLGSVRVCAVHHWISLNMTHSAQGEVQPKCVGGGEQQNSRKAEEVLHAVGGGQCKNSVIRDSFRILSG